MLESRLRGENIPVIMENEILFNSAIHWEIGLAIPLRVRFSHEHEEQAHEIVKSLADSSTPLEP